MKKILALVLVLALFVPALAVAAPATYSIWTWLGSAEGWGAKSYSEIAVFQEVDKATDTTIDWVIQSDTSTFDLMMSSGDTTDGIYYAWNPLRQATYSTAGLIVDVKAEIYANMPNLAALIDSDPMIQKQLINEDGGIYFIPWITSTKALVFGEGFAVRQDWLDKFGLAIPKTTDEFYEMLKTFRTGDANGNGVEDEILTGYPSQVNRLTYAFGTVDDFHYLEDGKTVVYGPSTENYRDWLRFMNKMYEDDILDPDYFSWDRDIYMRRAQENRVGAYCDNPAVFSTITKDGASNGFEMNYVPMAYLEYNGVSSNLSSATKRYVQPYGVAITAKAENVGRFLEWFDYFFTPEGNTIANWGVEGVSYVVNADGTKSYSDAVMNDPQYSPSTALSKYAHASFVGVQSYEAAMALLPEEGRAFSAAWALSDNHMAIEPFIAFNADEIAINTAKRTDMNTTRDAWRDRFITGEKNLDTDWDAFIKELGAYGLAELTAVQQAASDRYQAK